MIEDFLCCKVYLNTEEDEFDTKKAKYSFGFIVGIDDEEDETKYLVEPCERIITGVDKYLEGYNVTWMNTVDLVEYCDEKPDNLRMTTERQKG